MAKNGHSELCSVVGNASGRSAVVKGGRGVRGRIIGEVLSGGRNITGTPLKQRQAPRPTRSSARHHVRPEPKLVTMGDDYSDFGLEDDWEDLRETAPSYSDGMIRQRQDEFNIFRYVGQVLSVASGGLGLFFFFAFFYWIVGEEFGRDLPFMHIVILPLLVAVWCGAKAGANAKRRIQAGVSLPVGALGAVLAALVIGAGFYAGAVFIGFYPVFVLAEFFEFTYEYRDILQLLDEGISQLYMMFRQGTYVVVPLFGVLLGFAFGKR